MSSCTSPIICRIMGITSTALTNISAPQSTGTELYRKVTLQTMAFLESHNVPSHLVHPSHIVGELLVTDQHGTIATSLYNTRMVYLVPSKSMVRQQRIGISIWERCSYKIIIIRRHLNFGFKNERCHLFPLTVVSSMVKTRTDQLEPTVNSALLQGNVIG